MPPKAGGKKGQDAADLGLMRAARFGRVKNTLSMGFGMCICCVRSFVRSFDISNGTIVRSLVLCFAYSSSFSFWVENDARLHYNL